MSDSPPEPNETPISNAKYITPAPKWSWQMNEAQEVEIMRGVDKMALPLFELKLQAPFLNHFMVPRYNQVTGDYYDSDAEEEKETTNEGWYEMCENKELANAPTCRFGILLMSHVADTPEVKASLESDLLLPDAFVHGNLGYLGQLVLNRDEINALRLFHATLMRAVTIATTKIDIENQEFLNFCRDRLTMEAIIVPLSLSIEEGYAALKIDSSERYTHSKTLERFVLWDLYGIFTKWATLKLYRVEEAKFGDIVRTSYGSATFIYIGALKGQNLNERISPNGNENGTGYKNRGSRIGGMTMRQYMAEKWGITRFEQEPNFLVYVIPLVFRTHLGPSHRPTATKYTLERHEKMKNGITVDSMIKLVPELVRKTPFSLYDMNVCAHLPTLLLALHRKLKTLDLSLLIWKSVFNLSLLEESITAPAALHINYERLETLGDSVIKFVTSQSLYLSYPNEDEGWLSQQRMNYISNRNLAYTESAQILTKHCFLNSLTVANAMRKVKWSEARASKKMRADLYEAILGACFHENGLQMSYNFLAWLDPKAGQLLAYTDKIKEEYLLKQDIIENMLGEHLNSRRCNFPKSLFGHTFKNTHLLVTAFTHPSQVYRPTGECYQRLEFLGDACLDVVITMLLYQESPIQLTPGAITKIRSELVSNANFAYLAFMHNFHDYLIYSVGSLFDAMEKYCWMIRCRLEELGTDDMEVLTGSEFLRGNPFPNHLSDVFEAVAGAIFLDSKCDFEYFCNIYTPILRPLLLKQLLMSEKAHPKSEVFNILQARHCLRFSVKEHDQEITATWHGIEISRIIRSQGKYFDGFQLYKIANQILSDPQVWLLCDCVTKVVPKTTKLTLSSKIAAASIITTTIAPLAHRTFG